MNIGPHIILVGTIDHLQTLVYDMKDNSNKNIIISK